MRSHRQVDMGAFTAAHLFGMGGGRRAPKKFLIIYNCSWGWDWPWPNWGGSIEGHAGFMSWGRGPGVGRLRGIMAMRNISPRPVDPRLGSGGRCPATGRPGPGLQTASRGSVPPAERRKNRLKPFFYIRNLRKMVNLDLSVQKCALHTIGVPVINYGDIYVWIFKL